MSRRKGRARRTQAVGRRRGVALRIEGDGSMDGVEVRLPGFSPEQYERVRALARAGRLEEPLLLKFVRAFSEAIGHDADAQRWTAADTGELLRWLNLAPEPRTTIVLAEGEGAGLPLTITGLSDEDVDEARRQVAAGNLGHVLVVRIVASFIEAVGVDITAHKWTGPEYVQLLEMLGFSPFEWSVSEDAELAQLLAGEVDGGGE